jgi:tetratricopeptide (TPR) repeat protein
VRASGSGRGRSRCSRTIRWAGVGPGSSRRGSRRYRDPREIELSTHGRAIDAETEVEHPHEDWIAPAARARRRSRDSRGSPSSSPSAGGARRAPRRRRELEPLALGALGILAYALVHAPLTREPAAASVAFVLFGAVLARRKPERRTLAIGAAIALAALAPWALAFARHGRAISDLERPTTARALEICPDSPLALEVRARALEQAGGDGNAVVEAWKRLLAVRPRASRHTQSSGSRSRRSGISSGHERSSSARSSSIPVTRACAVNLDHLNLELDLQEGRLEAGRPWLEGADPIAEECYARSRKERAGGDRALADLFEARAHLMWARQHAALGRFEDAVRSYRQCVRVTRDHVEGGAPRIRLELAAALASAGRKDEARTELAAVRSRDSGSRRPAGLGRRVPAQRRVALTAARSARSGRDARPEGPALRSHAALVLAFGIGHGSARSRKRATTAARASPRAARTRGRLRRDGPRDPGARGRSRGSRSSNERMRRSSSYLALLASRAVRRDGLRRPETRSTSSPRVASRSRSASARGRRE